MSIMSEEQKIIDLENEIRFLKDGLCEKEKQLEKKNDLIDVLQHRIEEMLDVLNSEKKLNYIKPIDIPVHNYISEDKIRERIKHNENQKNIVESIAKFEINNDGITAEGLEGLNDLIVYRIYEGVINELNYLLEEN